MIRVYRWDPSTKTGFCQERPDLPASAADVTGDAVVWIDLENPTPEEEAQVFEAFLKIHPLTLDDVTRPRRLPEQGAHLPKVEEFPNYLFVVVNPLPWEVCDPKHDVPPEFEETMQPGMPKKHSPRVGWKRPQLSGVLTHNVLITHHYDELLCVKTVGDYVHRRGEAARRGPDFLFHLILDEMVDEYAPVVERFGERLDKLEIRLFSKPNRHTLTHLLRLKRQVISLRKTLILEREVLARLVRGEFELVQHEEIAYYRNVYDHLVRYTELIEGAREMVSDLMQTHLAAASNRLNEIMKVLTMISTIGLFCTLIAGIYGMNFEHMPELKWEYGYYYALGLMAAVAAATLGFFRWRKWI
ncbi:magnesium/cobalt transporter CorA [Limnoglobus roseus]|uniref:Magnesium transport protein CorA n=1 Tax=Limnoglobus roseus TaxID=2598579 RepID=A0A5C1A7I9_9BACT|nr:magnesium/cobalt transporter CorA [Limnoglobus roseus]QEL13956.1 magnesium and cobalt transport protein CorA [Limnoglobus roseus]